MSAFPLGRSSLIQPGSNRLTDPDNCCGGKVFLEPVRGNSVDIFMKKSYLYVILPLLALSLSFASPVCAAEGGGEWVRVSNRWLLDRFVRCSNTPAKEYRVAISIPARSDLRLVKPTVVRSSGDKDIDLVAADYARQTARNTASLREMAKTKELYFQLSLTPPALDINMRSEAGRRAMPSGSEVSMPEEKSIPINPRDSGEMDKIGTMAIVFPPGGGHAMWGTIPVSTYNAGADRYYLHNAVLNWQISRKSSQEQVLRKEIGVRRPTHGESIYN